MENQLNPQIVNLAKALRQTESGNDYTKSGASGESGGYQILPSTWKQYAKDAGVSTPLEQATPEEQNKVVYTKLKNWKDQGYDVGQIASMWNAGEGEPDAYLGNFSNGQPSTGKNAGGISFDVPSYAEKVAKNYHEIQGDTPMEQPQQPTENKKSLEGLLSYIGSGEKELLQGAGGILGSVFGLSGMNAKTAGGLGGMAIASAIAPGTGLLKVAAPIIGQELGSQVGEKVGEATGIGTEKSQQTPQIQQEPQTQPLETQATQKDLSRILGASNQVKNAIETSLQGTQSGRNFIQSDSGKQAVDTASVFGLITPDENGILQFDEDKREKLLGKIGDLQDKIIEGQDKTDSPLSVLTQAFQFIEGNKLSTAAEKDEAIKEAIKEVKANGFHLQDTSEQMSLPDMRQAQKAHYAAGRKGYGAGRTSSQVLAHMALGNAYGKVIKNNLPNDELYDRTKKMEKQLINVQSLANKVQGKKAPRQGGVVKELAHAGAKYAAIYIGDRIGGPIGAILGSMVGTHLTKAVDKKFGKTIFESPSMQKALLILQQGEPQIYTKLVEELKKYGVQTPEATKQVMQSLDEPHEIKSEIKELKNATSGLVRSPKKTKALLSRKATKTNRRERIPTLAELRRNQSKKTS